MARPNTYNTDDLIENPAYVTESIIRDWILTEFDLLIDSILGDDVTIDGTVNSTPLRVEIDDYYNGAILVNVTRNERYSVSDYEGSSQTLTLSATPAGWSAGDKCYLKNIQANIDENAFDALGAGVVETGTTTSTTTNKLIDSAQNFSSTVLAGMRVKNTTDTTYSYVKSVDSNTQLTLEDDIIISGENYSIYGAREGWKFARSLNTQQTSQQVLNQLCYESHCMLFKSYNDYRLVALEDGNTVGTLTQPYIENGLPQISTKLTSLLNIYTDFTLNYAYNYAKKIYTKKATVNKNATSNAYLDSLKTYCSDAETNYKVSRKFEYNSDWIQDDSTALYLLERLVLWNTYQRMIISWTGDIENHIHYEIGDRVLINYDYMMPTGKNNSQVYIIIGKTISPKKKVVQFSLLY